MKISLQGNLGLGVLCLCWVWPALLTADPVEPWPQFRGPQGQGLSTATSLPEHWSPDSDNIRWKTDLPGFGVSSPVISHQQVFITTAYDTPEGTSLLRTIYGLGIGLSGLILIAWFLHYLRAYRQRQQPASQWPGTKVSLWVEAINSLMICLFVLMAFVATVFPTTFNGWLTPLGQWVARFHPDLLAIVTLDPAVEAGVWLTGGGIALIGLAATAMMLRGLIWRLALLAVLGGGAWLLYQHTPLDEWYQEIEPIEKMLFLIPGIALGCGALISSFKLESNGPSDEVQTQKSLNQYRLTLRYPKAWIPADLSASLAALGLLLLAALVFVPGNYLFAEHGITRAVLSLSPETGDILWHTPVWTDQAERKHSDSSYATPTCATDGEHVLAFFGGTLVCLNVEGDILWQQHDQEFIQNAKYGSSSSPIIVEDLAVVLQGKEHLSKRPAWLAAFDIHTGDERWRIHPEDIGEGYTTPLAYVHPDGGVQLLVHSEERLNAYDLANGALLWSIKSPIDQMVASLVLADSTLIAGGGTLGPKVILAMSLSESFHEKPSIKWQVKGGTPECSTPLIIDDRLYALTDRGMLTCYKLNTGRMLWRERLQGRHLASLVAGAGKLYAVNTKGRTTVLDAQATDRAKILATNLIPGQCHATPALAQGYMIQRIGNQLICIESD